MTRRTAVVGAAVVLALFSAGCSSAPAADFVPLLTGVSSLMGSGEGCFTNWADGPLVADPNYGTAIEIGFGPATPVAWRPGFTGRRVGSEVEVRAPDGHVVAITGKNYRLDGAQVGPDEQGWPGLAVRVFWACGRVTER